MSNDPGVSFAGQFLFRFMPVMPKDRDFSQGPRISNRTRPLLGDPSLRLKSGCTRDDDIKKQANFYSSLAFIVIFAFRTFETGQPFSAASANF